MARDNAIDFTENRYASRKEMSNELGIVVPNEMWSKVLAYRSNFMNTLPLLDGSDRPICLCLYPTLASKCNQVESKLIRFLNNSSKLDDLNGNKQHFRITLLADALSNIAQINNISLEISRINKLVVSENPFDEEEEQVLNYLDAINYVEQRYVNKIDVDFLADLYSKVTGVDELTSFYRQSDLVDGETLVLVNRFNKSAPFEKIEGMMDSLFNFIENSEISYLNKAVITFYYVNYVRPFSNYNEEIAALLAKAVFAHFSLGEAAILLPVERLLTEKAELVRKMNQEVQSSTDLTYFFSPTVNKFDKDLDDFLAILRDYSLNDMKMDFYQPEPEPAKKEEPVKEPVKEEEIDENNLLGLSFASEEEPETPKQKPIKQEVKTEPIKEEPVKVEEKVKKQPQKVEIIEEVVENPQGLAINYLPAELDEKEARRLEENLLELDVRLKKGEAKFYARHCTLGRYYTIEQYKKLNKCVYETARTSMDHLVELGYYKKAKVGKKFVYTPIKR